MLKLTNCDLMEIRKDVKRKLQIGSDTEPLLCQDGSRLLSIDFSKCTKCNQYAQINLSNLCFDCWKVLS